MIPAACHLCTLFQHVVSDSLTLRAMGASGIKERLINDFGFAGIAA